jgi:O-antigen/teichoic acid export membrane protein
MRAQLLILIKNNKEKGLVLIDQGLVSGVNFLVGILLARFLGVEVFGLFSLAWMVLFFASGLQQAFLTAPLFALTARQNDRSSWFAQLLTVQLFVSVASFLLVVLAVELCQFIQPAWYVPNISVILGLLVAVYLFNDFRRRVLFVKHKSREVVTVDVFGYALQPVFLVALYIFDALDLSTALASILLAQSISLSYILIAIRSRFQMKGILTTTKKLWKYSRFLVATSFLQWSSANYIILFAASILGPAAIGAIRVSQNLMGVLNVLFQAMENIIPARSAEAFHKGGLSELGNYMKKTTLQLILPVVFFLSGIAVFHQQIMTLVYGDEYLPYSFILLAFCGIYVFVFLGTLLRFVIRTLEYNQLIFISYVLTTAFSLLAGKALASHYGLTGVMLGIAGTQIISLISFISFLKFKVKWNFRLFTFS